MHSSTILSMGVVTAPDPRLKVQTKPVKKITPGLLSTIADMIKLTKTFKDPEGVGLAATQIGLNERFFVALLNTSEGTAQSADGSPVETLGMASRNPEHPKVKMSANKEKKFMAVINPKIISSSKRTKTYFEGCLSTPNIWGEIKRHTQIKVSFQDQTGKLITTSLKGVLAWIFQHEIDHLDGILFQDRVLQQKGKFYKFTGKDKTGTDNFQEITL